MEKTSKKEKTPGPKEKTSASKEKTPGPKEKTSASKEKTPAPKTEQQLKDEEEIKKMQQQILEEEKKDDEAFPGHVERYRVIGTYYFGKNQESKLIEFDSALKCNNTIFIEGLTGVGISSAVVSSYLVGHLKLPLVAVFESDHLPAMCSVHKYLATSAIRIYGNETVCVALGDHQISSVNQSELVWDMAYAFADFARRHFCTHIITIDGYPVKADVEKEIQSIVQLLPQKNENGVVISGDEDEDEYEDDEENDENEITIEANIEDEKDDKNIVTAKSDPKKSPFEIIGFLTTSKDIGPLLKKMGHEPVKTGQILGVTGAMLVWSFTAKNDDPPLTCLLAPDPVEIPDQRGALLTINLLKAIWNIQVNTAELEIEAKRLAQKIQSTFENIRDQVKKQYSQSTSKPPPGMYL